MKAQLRALIEQGLTALRNAGTLPADLPSPDFAVERPKERAHGDFSTNAAMLLAKAAKSNPRALAQQLVDALPASDAVAKIELAGPGFINFHLAPGAWQLQVRDIHAAGPAFGRNASGGGTQGPRERSPGGCDDPGADAEDPPRQGRDLPGRIRQHA